VEVAAGLIAVQQHVGGVEVEDDLGRSRRVGPQEQIDQQAFDGLAVGDDLLVPGGPPGADRRQLHAVERALARQRRAAAGLPMTPPAQHVLATARRNLPGASKGSNRSRS